MAPPSGTTSRNDSAEPNPKTIITNLTGRAEKSQEQEGNALESWSSQEIRALWENDNGRYPITVFI